jgi:phenylacetate-CoA ligase
VSISTLSVYHSLPAPARSVAASLRGYYLRWWRYGGETERLVGEALERERWSPECLKAWQEERLARVLHLAATKVPYYREHWAGRRRSGDRATWEVLENWPILRKEALRETPRAFVAEGSDTRRMFQEQTSGTTGTPLTLWCKRGTVQHWYALAEARWRRWYGVSLDDRWAMAGGQRVVPFEQSRPPFWVWNAGLKQLYMSAMHARPDYLRHYLSAIRRYSVVYLYGYSSTLYWLALQALEVGARIDLKVVVTDAEPLYDYQREAIERAFNCPVRETYGQSEAVCAMSECEHGRLHLWPEAGYAEVLDEHDRAAPRGEVGKLICTGLLNDAMPLVRYEVRDMAQLPAENAACPCGRSLPVVEKVVGRLDDAIITKDGRRLALLDVIFGPELHVQEAQLIQESLDLMRVRVVPAAGWSAADEQQIRAALRQRMGEVEVLVEAVPQIERTWAGKFRVMISKVDAGTSGAAAPAG